MNELANITRADGCLRELALFAGAGGGVLGGKLLGWRTVCAVERDAYAAQVLAQRQNDGVLEPFPIWSNIESFDGKPWKGIVDVVSGGFPCQDISIAGKGAGINGKRSGLWAEMARIISEVRPRFVFVENSPLLVSRGLARVLADLAKMGFDAQWGVIGADDLGALHIRKRMWIVAYTDQNRCSGENISLQQGGQDKSESFVTWSGEDATNAGSNRLEGAIYLEDHKKPHGYDAWSEIDRGIESHCWQSDHPEPGILGMDDGLAHWKYRIAAIGNGQIPALAAAAWKILGGEE